MKYEGEFSDGKVCFSIPCTALLCVCVCVSVSVSVCACVCTLFLSSPSSQPHTHMRAHARSQANGAGKVTFPDGSQGRPRQEGTFQDRKLVTGGKQQAAVRQAQDAQQMAQQKASEAAALK